jgi:hypothetical protein
MLLPAVKAKIYVSLDLSIEVLLAWPSRIGQVAVDVKVAYGRVQ